MNLNGPLLFAMVFLVVVGSAMGCQGKKQLIQPGQRYENPKIGYEFEETAEATASTGASEGLQADASVFGAGHGSGIFTDLQVLVPSWMRTQ